MPILWGDEMEEAKEKKRWLGTWPADCDLCNISLKQFRSFIDGRTIWGPWALMCPACHEYNGVGLGLGKGQKFDSKTLKKIEG